MKELVDSLLRRGIERANRAGRLKTKDVAITLEAPRDPNHGDLANNAPLLLAKAEGKPPLTIAEVIREYMEIPPEIEITIARPGFINFRMAPTYWRSELKRAAAAGPGFVYPQVGGGRKVQVEFLSANPTGPLTVGHGRNAVLGDTIARLHHATGYQVTREYYFNDGGRQMKLLAKSVRARYLEEMGLPAEMPEDGYHGEYIREIAQMLRTTHGQTLVDEAADAEVYRAAAVRTIFADIRHTCERLGISFDIYTNELDLIRGGQVEAALNGLRSRGLIEERDGALWLKGEVLNLPNQKDQVLVRSTGEPTYRTPDIAYHIEKLKRRFDEVIDVFGADHIAEHEGVIAAVKALGYDTRPIRAIIYQFVTLTRGGEKVKMSTRRATYVTLDELIDEVGPDVVRFFFLFRKHDTHLDFDLDLAKRQAPENPVFYVQYAHARLASVFREAEKAGFTFDDNHAADLQLLGKEELALAKKALGLRDVVADATTGLEPHRIPFYLLELAGDFHRYYNKPANRIIDAEHREVSLARLFLAQVLKNAIASGLQLLGVTSPERM
jgi:arginyl-tRNA synthetase